MQKKFQCKIIDCSAQVNCKVSKYPASPAKVTKIAMAPNVWTANRNAAFKSNVLTIKGG
eukprot:COSAG01_NODE_10090_length_2252_cov_6.975383_2_plen_58_part_01